MTEKNGTAHLPYIVRSIATWKSIPIAYSSRSFSNCTQNCEWDISFLLWFYRCSDVKSIDVAGTLTTAILSNFDCCAESIVWVTGGHSLKSIQFLTHLSLPFVAHCPPEICTCTDAFAGKSRDNVSFWFTFHHITVIFRIFEFKWIGIIHIFFHSQRK